MSLEGVMAVWERFKSALAPALTAPVLIVESDDWGPGHKAQIQALNAICSLLQGFKDHRGQPPVMTIGVVLSLPDPEAIAKTGTYHARFLDDPDYRPVLEILKAGEKEGVFDLQLHGLAHFWPENFMVAWRQDEKIKRWLSEDGWRTEKLPAWLQSRWIDAAWLPSRPLPPAAIEAAVDEEVRCFRRCFGRSPKVAVPPTFVWNEIVERAYAKAGIEVLITPGKRYGGRDRAGKLLPPEQSYGCGERLPCGLTALVRDVYFEPALGHKPKAVLEAVERKWRRREPALLEMHRFNFLDGKLQASLDALGTLLDKALARFPKLRFMSSYELAGKMNNLSCSVLERARVAWRRLRT
ncbi:MAG: hypothetical protein ACK4JF_08950 [Methylohalobius sp.]